MAPKHSVLQLFWGSWVGLGAADEGQTCRVGDIVGDTVRERLSEDKCDAKRASSSDDGRVTPISGIAVWTLSRG